MNKHKINQIEARSQKLGSLVLLLQLMERSPRMYGEAGELTPSEIHAIDAIGYHEKVLMNELANRLGVTKAAITQIIKRLEGKGMVMREPNPDDLRGTLISLSDKGRIAYNVQAEVRSIFYRQLDVQLDEKEWEVFDKLIDKIIVFLKEQS